MMATWLPVGVRPGRVHRGAEDGSERRAPCRRNGPPPRRMVRAGSSAVSAPPQDSPDYTNLPEASFLVFIVFLVMFYTKMRDTSEGRRGEMEKMRFAWLSKMSNILSLGSDRGPGAGKVIRASGPCRDLLDTARMGGFNGYPSEPAGPVELMSRRSSGSSYNAHVRGHDPASLSADQDTNGLFLRTRVWSGSHGATARPRSPAPWRR